MPEFSENLPTNLLHLFLNEAKARIDQGIAIQLPIIFPSKEDIYFLRLWDLVLSGVMIIKRWYEEGYVAEDDYSLEREIINLVFKVLTNNHQFVPKEVDRFINSFDDIQHAAVRIVEECTEEWKWRIYRAPDFDGIYRLDDGRYLIFR